MSKEGIYHFKKITAKEQIILLLNKAKYTPTLEKVAFMGDSMESSPDGQLHTVC